MALPVSRPPAASETDVSLPFEHAAASVVGRAHARLGRNNQDAFHVAVGHDALVAIVADGCGSGGASEVGARIGARLLARAVLVALGRGLEIDDALESARLALLAELRRLVEVLGADAVEEQLLFTLLGVALTTAATATFAIGDGVLGVNGILRRLEAPGNAPEYLGYALLDPARAVRFAIHHRIPTADVRSVLVGSDGAADATALQLAAAAPDDESCFRNPDGLARRLRLLNRETTRVEWDARRIVRGGGRLADDATLVLVRRKSA